MDKAAEKKEKDKIKRQQARWSKMLAGMDELSLWLHDLLRVGLISLPDRSRRYWDDMDKRLIDAQAPGLAAMVRTLRDLPYKEGTEWQQQAVDIIGKMWMIIRGFSKMYELPEPQQADLKALAGWGAGPKEVLNDPNALSIKDNWLVAGRSTELIDDITTQRNWLLGLHTGHFALILQFAFKNMPIESNFAPGNAYTMDLAFFPSATPLRAVVREQGKVVSSEHSLSPFPNWAAVEADRAVQLAINPLLDQFPVFVAQITPFFEHSRAFLFDIDQKVIPLETQTDPLPFLRLMAISGGQPLDVLLLVTGTGTSVLGCLQDGKYMLILST
ncbi:MAG: hypothetical protein RIR11_1623 [Bacteroidota bacterium]|jgi:hypothetical protein